LFLANRATLGLKGNMVLLKQIQILVCNFKLQHTYRGNVIILQPSMRNRNKNLDFVWMVPWAIKAHKTLWSVLNVGHITE